MGKESLREEYVCLQICVQCVETKGQLRVSLLRHHPPCLLKSGLSLAWNSLISLGWLPQQAPGAAHFCLPMPRLQTCAAPVPGFFVLFLNSGDSTQIFTLVW